jgi:hypothetical protein
MGSVMLSRRYVTPEEKRRPNQQSTRQTAELENARIDLDVLVDV